MVKSATFRARQSRSLNRSRAKSMRHDPAYVERLVWSHLRDHKLGGWKFRRQVPVGRYIADYVCAQKKVIVELDGGVHKLRTARDRIRDVHLRNSGYIVLRFENNDVLRDLPGVLAKILQVIETAPSPWPSPPEGERVETEH
jgi:very-short-patch-repair endonuclease